MWSYCWTKVWLLSTKKDFYNPQLWDKIVVKINPENNYINELFVVTEKNWKEVNDFLYTLKEPYCTWWIINTETKKEEIKTTSEIQTKKEDIININYTFFWIILFLIIIIWVLSFKICKFKNQE